MSYRLTLLPILLASIICPAIPAAGEQSIHVEWGYTPPSNPAVAGFRMYQEGRQVCETRNPKALSMDCRVSPQRDTTLFTITALFNDGSESAHSAPFPFQSKKKIHSARLATTPTTGSSPLSTPTVASPDRQSPLGDKAPGTRSFAAGNKPATSTSAKNYHFNNSNKAQASTMTDKAAPKNDLIAQGAEAALNTIISASASTGPAPLQVSFKSSQSSPRDDTPVTHTWHFGDGKVSTGEQVQHTFTEPGTYGVRLTTKDRHGLTSFESLPIIVTSAPTGGTPPIQTKITTSSASGRAPLTVTFNAEGATENNDSSHNYTWFFGDGTTATGRSASHTYTTEADFTASLQITANQKVIDTVSTTIRVNNSEKQAPFHLEMGEIDISSEWVRVQLETPFTTPVVVTAAPKLSTLPPGAVRLRNIDASGFDIKFIAETSSDSKDAPLTVNYLVVEKGRFALNETTTVEAGIASGYTRLNAIQFREPFAKRPIVLATIGSTNRETTTRAQLADINGEGFEYQLSQQKGSKEQAAEEAVHYIAWQQGSGNFKGLIFDAGRSETKANSSREEMRSPAAAPGQAFLFPDTRSATSEKKKMVGLEQADSSGFQLQNDHKQSKANDNSNGDSRYYLSIGTGVEGENDDGEQEISVE